MRTMLIIVIAGALAPGFATAQGMCVPDPLRAKATRGRVYLEAEGKRVGLGDVQVELAPFGYNKAAVAKVKTGPDGSFDLGVQKPGKYYISVRHESVIGFAVELRLQRGRAGPREIVFILRNNPTKPCGDGSVGVELIQSATAHKHRDIKRGQEHNALFRCGPKPQDVVSGGQSPAARQLVITTSCVF